MESYAALKAPLFHGSGRFVETPPSAAEAGIIAWRGFAARLNAVPFPVKIKVKSKFNQDLDLDEKSKSKASGQNLPELAKGSVRSTRLVKRKRAGFHHMTSLKFLGKTGPFAGPLDIESKRFAVQNNAEYEY